MAYKQFIKPENKAMLWKLMENGNMFNGISDEYVSTIKYEFDKKIYEITTKNVTLGYSLIQLNKMFISEMLAYLEKFKETISKIKESSRQVSTFQDALEKKKEDFNALMLNKPPDKVDFSDKFDDKPISSNNIEAILAETISRREKELNIVLDTQTKNEKINGNNNNNNGNNNIRIGSVLKKNEVLKVKQVRFSDKVEMKEHLNIEYDDTADANEVGANEVGANEVDSRARSEVEESEEVESYENQNKDVLIARKDYDILLEKINGILNKSKLDIENVIRELLKSKQV